MSTPQISKPGFSWRLDAARIVEELFQQTTPEHWDLLLELRRGLVAGSDWPTTLDYFLQCRYALEADHYLPFFRLRRLIANGLRLEVLSKNAAPEDRQQLSTILTRKHRSLDHLRRSMHRELFEAGIDIADASDVQLLLTEKSASAS